MYKFIFKDKAAKETERLPDKIRRRILEKLKFFTSQTNPLIFAEKIKDPRLGEWRYRIGEYRVIFDLKNTNIVILKVGHRRDVYK